MKVNTEETLRRDTMKIVAEIGMPEGFESGMRFTPNPNSPNGRHMVIVNMDWDDTVNFFGRFPKTFHRSIEREMALQN